MLRLSNFSIQEQKTFGEFRDERVYPVSDEFRKNFSSISGVIDNDALERLIIDLKKNVKSFLIKEIKLLPPISTSSRIFCVGLNYPKNKIHFSISL